MAALLITEYRAIEAQIKALEDRLAALGGNDNFRAKIDGLEKIKQVMAESGLSRADVLSFLGVNSRETNHSVISGKVREVKTWVNPHTGEHYSAKRASGPVVDWISEYGKQAVSSWIKN